MVKIQPRIALLYLFGLVFLTLPPGRPAFFTLQATSTPPPGVDPAFTPPPFVPLETSTPLADGAIVHIVGPGQTLWSIALSYGVRIEDIRQLNDLPEGSTDIYAGQKLIIRLGGSSTPPATQENTAEPSLQATRTRRPTSTLPPSATHKPTATATRTATPVSSETTLIPGVRLPDNQTLGLILLGFSLVGIALVLVFGFLRK